jgi:hypothetical protein
VRKKEWENAESPEKYAVLTTKTVDKTFYQTLRLGRTLRSTGHGSRVTDHDKIYRDYKLLRQEGLFIVIEAKNGRILRVHTQKYQEKHLV